ncbi:hypothetical protein AMS68_001542 [Peltaster fructicola]|uniref:DUF1750-domain-containing protein n=1 Tax=Peltaster fructicola TaxID=286661 RepID=A0A6H0XN12_9PEZI|nr:hypothetical protein AMS68_001542 [Peltaster fructicola]
MQDPSAGVQPPLDKHVHLISSHSYPIIAQINIEQAFGFLLQAPPVVKQIAPMSWTYVNAPQEGTVWLEWLSPAQNGGRFPSDGYVWSDPEQSYRHNVNGYTIEVLMHQSGFRPGLDHMTSHARTRYHLTAKAPHINAATPDPSLWIVHYHHAPQQRILPTSQVQLDQYTRHIMNERAWLERQGRIERRDFMLHDREHWPTITMPNQAQQMQHAGYYGQGAAQNQAMMMQNRYGQPPFPQPAGPPSAKRQRTQGPGPLVGPQEAAAQDHNIEDEEYTALGDYFDYLTPREISMTRFQQHQTWMEEVLQSPYATRNIMPVDLGLGLMGSLKGLTEGILQPPPVDEFLDKETDTTTRAHAFSHVPQDQLEEFNTRVQKHIDEGKAEMDRLKAEHAVKMREWRKTHKLTQAETQLRNAAWKGHESSLFKASEDSSDDYANAIHAEDVIDSIERLVGLKVKPHNDAALVAEGGLQRLERRPIDVPTTNPSQAPSVAALDTVSFQRDSANGQNVASHEAKAASTVAEQSNLANDTPDRNAEAALSNIVGQDGTDNGLDLLNDSMELDAADLGFDLNESSGQDTLNATGTELNAVQPSGVRSASDNAATAEAASTSNNAQLDTEAGMFNDGNFDFDNELGATGDEVGDGLIDFGDEDGIGMDDSAFGDALHGMDS